MVKTYRNSTDWRKAEKKDAKDFKGEEQRGSGNTWKHKLDVKSDEFLVETKSTANKSYSIKRGLWEKIRRAAIMEGRTGLLSIHFIGGRNLVVLDKEDFLALTEE